MNSDLTQLKSEKAMDELISACQSYSEQAMDELSSAPVIQ